MLITVVLNNRKTKKETNVKISVNVEPRRVCDLFVNAIEGGCSYWMQAAVYAGKGKPGRNWYDNPAIFEGNPISPIFKAEFDKHELEEGNGKGRKLIGLREIQKGIERMAKMYPEHFADMLNEDDDIQTADVMMQCIVLGDVFYG